MAQIHASIIDLEARKLLEVVLADLTALRNTVAAIRVDVAANKTAWDAFISKLNTDTTAQNGAVAGSQLDTDYAGPGALTSAAPAALTLKA